MTVPKNSQDIKGKVNNDDINVRFLVSYDPQREMVVVKGQEGDGVWSMTMAIANHSSSNHSLSIQG